MSSRSPQCLLEDMQEALGRIQRYIEGLDVNTFMTDDKTADAVVRNLEIIGEAANRLPDDFCAQHAEIEWRKMIGLRHRIVHDYFGVDLALVWEIVTSSAPVLARQLSRIADSSSPPSS